MRELQRQRQRTKGVALDIRAEGGAAEEGGGEEGGDAGDGGAGLDSTFTAQADASEVDPNMLRYIEEQMKNGDSAAFISSLMTFVFSISSPVRSFRLSANIQSKTIKCFNNRITNFICFRLERN